MITDVVSLCEKVVVAGIAGLRVELDHCGDAVIGGEGHAATLSGVQLDDGRIRLD